ncbi:transposase, partial [Psychromonas sp. Urea-02u-13]|uniref:transposase n=1 Tax=Psychromonas sp. Urea-02u-13 TaxID=2058326 RepID=UPI000CBEAF40
NITKTRTLPILKFLWLILQHVLPKGLQRVRDYGFLRGNAKQLRLQILLLLGINIDTVSTPQKSKQSKCICPYCQHQMSFMGMNRLRG